MLLIMLISVALIVFFAGNAAGREVPAHACPPCAGNSIPSRKDRANANATAAPTSRSPTGGQSLWTTSRRSELAFVVKEVLLLRGVWENFRGLWLWSWLLHWGLYLYVLATTFAVVEICRAARPRLRDTSCRGGLRLWNGVFPRLGWRHWSGCHAKLASAPQGFHDAPRHL